MHIRFDASGREPRLTFVNAPDDDDLLQQAQINTQRPLQNFEFDIQTAAKGVLQGVDDAYTKSRSSIWPWKWFRSRDAADAADARAATNGIVQDLVEQAGVQAQKETDKTFLSIQKLAAKSTDEFFFHSLRLRTVEQSLKEHRERKVNLTKALQAYTSLCAQTGMTVSPELLEEQRKRIESLDERTERYESLLERSREVVQEQRSSAEFKTLEAMEDKLRRSLLKQDPQLADRLDNLIRGAISGNDDLLAVINTIYMPGGSMSAEGWEMRRIALELAGRNTWLFIDRKKRSQAADYYSIRLMEKRDLNPDALKDRLAALRESRIGQRVRMTIGGDASTYILMDRPNDTRLQLRLIDGNGPGVVLLATDGAVPQLVQPGNGGSTRVNLSAPAFRVSDDPSMTYLAA